MLLKGINDDVDTLKSLYHGLLMRRVRPYYLYQCDPITGSAHFRTSVDKGLEIMQGLRGHTTGYAVPTYVIDAPGGGGKIPLLPDYVVGRDGDDLLLRNFEGQDLSLPRSGRDGRRRSRRRAPVTSDAHRPRLRPARRLSRARPLRGGDRRVRQRRHHRSARRRARRRSAARWIRIGRGQALAARLVAGERWDVVFNIAEGVKGRSREAQVPALFELFDQPYVFSDPLTRAR